MKNSIYFYLLSFIFFFSALFLFFGFLKPTVVWAQTCTDYGGAPCSLCGGNNCSLCWCEYYWEVSCGGCSGGGSSFTGDTKIATPSGEKEIKDLKEGDVVKSFNPETGEIKESTVSAVHKREVSEYYILKTESGREIKVTGEHPILAVKASKSEAPNPKSETPLRQGFVRGAANSKLKILNSKLREFAENIWRKMMEMVK